MAVLAKETGPCNSASGFVVLQQVATKSIQNNQSLNFSADPSHKIWELVHTWCMSAVHPSFTQQE